LLTVTRRVHAAGNVLAFQRLWNYNHPSGLIAEDGV
jgi:hypothetical protein